MNITRKNIDALNAIVKIDITKEDYNSKVEKILNDYRKKSDIPGFRKGQVPMGMVRKQYEKSVIVDEVNKLLQENLNKFLNEEKIEILGNPLPRIDPNFSWETNDEYSFEFELGLTPEFEVDVTGENKITEYQIEANDSLLCEEVENIKKRYGKVTPIEIAEDDSNVTGVFVNTDKGIETKGTLNVNDLLENKNKKKVIGAKVGDVIELASKELFEEDFKLSQAISVPLNQIKDLDVTLSFTVEEISKTDPAELNQELFDKLFPDGSITAEADLKKKIKEDAENQFQQQADQQLLNAITEHFVENTKFDLPTEFLQKWIQNAGEKQLSLEEAKAEYENSEKGLRYQLIEGKIMSTNDVKLEYEEIIDYAKGFIRAQMLQFGNAEPDEEEVTQIAQRLLSNQEEAQRLQQQLISQKILEFYKTNMTFKTKTVDYKKFIEEVYS